MIEIKSDHILFAGQVDFGSLEAEGYKFGPTAKALSETGERLHNKEGEPFWRAAIVQRPGGVAVLRTTPPGVSSSSSAPGLEKGVQAVFQQHLGPREITATREQIPPPDAERCLQLLDMEIERRGKLIDDLKNELNTESARAHNATVSAEKATHAKDLALQNESAAKQRLDRAKAIVHAKKGDAAAKLAELEAFFA